MKLALWDIRPCGLIAEAARRAGIEVVEADISGCREFLRTGEVDAALLPPSLVLRETEDLTILPDAVLASGSTFPYVTLRLHRPIDQIEAVDVLESDRSIGELAEIVLREQYRLDANFRVRNTVSTNGSAPDAALDFGNPHPDSTEVASEAGTMWLDVGQEWFEMTGFPMVWGLLVIRAGLDGGQFNETVERMSTVLSDIRTGWIDTLPEGPGAVGDEERSALAHDVFFRFNPDVVTGLDELAHYLFYFGIVDDIPVPRFTRPPESLRPST